MAASPIITPIPVQTDTEYRPISRLAVAGLLLALPSVLLFASNNLSWVFFLFTLPAVVLATVALQAIVKSDGALAGEAVARLAIVIAVACGLGWVTNEVVTKYVTELEARTVADDWLEKMRKGEPGAAFLLSQHPKMRGVTFHPEEYNKLRKQFPAAQEASQFDAFLSDPIYGQLMRYGEEAKFAYVGSVDHQARPGSITYNFKYRLTTPEVEGDIIVVIRSEDVQNEQGIRREWILSCDRAAARLRGTKLGEEVAYAAVQVEEVLDKLFRSVANERRPEVDALLTKEPSKRGEFELVYGYLRNNIEGRGVSVGVQKPIRLRSAKKVNGVWLMTFDCTALVEGEKIVEFSIDATGDSADKTKWALQNCRFVGTRSVLAPEDDPNAPKMLRRLGAE
jgi:hypothetical protein